MPEFRPSTAHQSLGDTFYDVVAPAQFPTLTLRHRNQRWAERIGLGDLTEAQWLEHFGRFAPLPGSLAQPLALRYHGHQFQTYNPDLGDGRGFLFAQAHDLVDGRLLDLATKGSGTTPWSRRADGRLTLKGGVREVLATEMLEALGVDTSKSFSLTETGESLNRHDEPSPTRGSAGGVARPRRAALVEAARVPFQKLPERRGVRPPRKHGAAERGCDWNWLLSGWLIALID